jgi:hypothetical protein
MADAKLVLRLGKVTRKAPPTNQDREAWLEIADEDSPDRTIEIKVRDQGVVRTLLRLTI